jgi:hypothetical protein
MLKRKSIILGSKEFGETFHLAACLLANPTIKIIFKKMGKQLIKHQRLFLQQVLRGRLVEEIATHKISDSTKLTKGKIHANDICAAFSRIAERNKKGVKKYLEEKLNKSGNKVLVWIRQGDYQPWRNTSISSLRKVKKTIQNLHLLPVLMGPKIKGMTTKASLIEHFKIKPFEGKIGPQLYLLKLLKDQYNVVASCGMMSGGMDAGAFLGISTIYFAHPNYEDHDRFDKLPKEFKFIKILLNKNYCPKENPDFSNRVLAELRKRLRALSR